MVDIFKYHKVSKSDMVSARKAALSLMKDSGEEEKIYQPNTFVENGSEGIDDIPNSMNTVKEVKWDEKLLQEQMTSALEKLKQEMPTRSEIERQIKFNQEIDKAIEDLKQETKMVQAQFEIEVLKRKEKEDRSSKLDSKLDRFVQFFKRELEEIRAKFKLDEMSKQKTKEDIIELKKETEKLSKRMASLQKQIEDSEAKITKQVKKIQRQQMVLYEDQQKRKQSVDIYENYLWKRVTIHTNDSIFDGILVQISYDYLVLIDSNDIYIAPLQNINVISLSAQ